MELFRKRQKSSDLKWLQKKSKSDYLFYFIFLYSAFYVGILEIFLMIWSLPVSIIVHSENSTMFLEQTFDDFVFKKTRYFQRQLRPVHGKQTSPKLFGSIRDDNSISGPTVQRKQTVRIRFRDWIENLFLHGILI